MYKFLLLVVLELVWAFAAQAAVDLMSCLYLHKYSKIVGVFDSKCFETNSFIRLANVAKLPFSITLNYALLMQ